MNPNFDEQIERVKFITGKKTQNELADLLGIKQSSVSDVKKRRAIPFSWLLILMRIKNIHPEWILTGKGPYTLPTQPEAGCYETGDAAAERRADEEALGAFPLVCWLMHWSGALLCHKTKPIAQRMTDKTGVTFPKSKKSKNQILP